MTRQRAVWATILAAGWLQGVHGATMLETRAWPTRTACNACVTLQFGELEMRLPVALAGRLFVFPGGPGGIHFLPVEGKSPSLMLAAKPLNEVIGIYPGVSLRTTGEQFYDMLGRPDRYAPAWRAEGVQSAVRYTKATNGQLRAYWIESAPGETQYVHIVADGDDMVYTFAGDFDAQWHEALLANLRRVQIP